MLIVVLLLAIPCWAFCTVAVPVLLLGAGARIFAKVRADVLAPLASIVLLPSTFFLRPQIWNGSTISDGLVVIAGLCPVAFIAALFARELVRKELVACNTLAVLSSLLAIPSCFSFVVAMSV